MKLYAPSLTLAEARRIYFEANGFGPNGGYDEAWVDFKLGPIPFPFPNTAGRVRAVKFHDLHHLVTGYDTNLIGELEIGAWEVGSGCADMLAAWQLNLQSLGTGALFAPRRTWRAFMSGRRSKNFYAARFDDALLATTIADARRQLGLDPEDGAGAADAAGAGAASAAGATKDASTTDVLLFGVATLAGLALGTAFLAVCVPLAFVAALPLRWLAARSPRTAAA
jgi:hypothetical protein